MRMAVSMAETIGEAARSDKETPRKDVSLQTSISSDHKLARQKNKTMKKILPDEDIAPMDTDALPH
jgi:hypothetical protein